MMLRQDLIRHLHQPTVMALEETNQGSCTLSPLPRQLQVGTPAGGGCGLGMCGYGCCMNHDGILAACSGGGCCHSI
jgi:hypothetical protein